MKCSLVWTLAKGGIISKLAVPLTQRVWIWHAVMTQNLISSNTGKTMLCGSNKLLLEVIPFDKSTSETESRDG